VSHKTLHGYFPLKLGSVGVAHPAWFEISFAGQSLHWGGWVGPHVLMLRNCTPVPEAEHLSFSKVHWKQGTAGSDP
jgi:hypothetical protein